MNESTLQASSPGPEELAMRAALGAALELWLRGAGLTQRAAAAVLGTTQARVSEIKHGKTAHFSLDLLVRLAARAGLQPRLSLTLPPAPAEGAR
ncbi:helix-turn-helix domain-containing protein [Massilia sp. DWR3-1-1]|uniref:helix-turn-helix domain-containing protein n=1 Tax=Massilia sp. DWR3-1-1 TaxID=2804559 RepID=UPI003CF1B441